MKYMKYIISAGKTGDDWTVILSNGKRVITSNAYHCAHAMREVKELNPDIKFIQTTGDLS